MPWTVEVQHVISQIYECRFTVAGVRVLSGVQGVDRYDARLRHRSGSLVVMFVSLKSLEVVEAQTAATDMKTE
jgi:hypothetical protein